MAVTALDHVNIETAELDKTVDFYVEVLGMTAGERPAFDFPGAWLYCGERAALHLVGVAERHDRSTGPVDHVAFEARDYEGTQAKLGARGLPYKTGAFANLGLRQIFVDDPNGVTVELNFRG